MRYVIIGASVAAVGVIEGIRSIDPDGTITVLTAEEDPYYSRTLISYYLAGKIDSQKLYYRQKSFYIRNNVDVICSEVAEINPEKSFIVTSGGRQLNYDCLALTVGGTPTLLDEISAGRENVIGFYTLQDARRIMRLVHSGTKTVIIGAGLVGLKAAEALHSLGVPVTVIDMAPHVMPGSLDEESGRIVQQHLVNQGINFRMGIEIKEIEGSPLINRLRLSDGEEVPCNLLIVAAGTTPNIALAKSVGIDTNRGILVDLHQRTSIPNIYAAGDVAEAMEVLSGRQNVVPLLPLAYDQGRVAGINMASGEAEYLESLALNSTSLLGLAIMSAGDSRADGVKTLNETSQNPYYRKIVLDQGIITGFIAINNVDKIGILTELIRKKINIQGMEQILLAPFLNQIDLEDLLHDVERGQQNELLMPKACTTAN
ncbi:MAG: NAD(P)/FAD-dependent oxidoreductase [Deltaproteobacteria bacterium]